MAKQIFLPRVVLVRHAQSEWNRQGRFTGWADPPLTGTGRDEAGRAGRALAAAGYDFDLAYSSVLVRARDTATIILRETGQLGVPLRSDWRLNERHYGGLQGLGKAEMAAQVGAEQVRRWRRGFDDRPPALASDDPGHPANDARWADIPARDRPNGESLAETRERVLGFWQREIAPQIRSGGRLLIASHGNTLRALIMALDGITPDRVEQFEVPTGVPLVYAFSASGEPVGWHYLDQGRSAA